MSRSRRLRLRRLSRLVALCRACVDVAEDVAVELAIPQGLPPVRQPVLVRRRTIEIDVAVGSRDDEFGPVLLRVARLVLEPCALSDLLEVERRRALALRVVRSILKSENEVSSSSERKGEGGADARASPSEFDSPAASRPRPPAGRPQASSPCRRQPTDTSERSPRSWRTRSCCESAASTARGSRGPVMVTREASARKLAICGHHERTRVMTWMSLGYSRKTLFIKMRPCRRIKFRCTSSSVVICVKGIVSARWRGESTRERTATRCNSFSRMRLVWRA